MPGLHVGLASYPYCSTVIGWGSCSESGSQIGFDWSPVKTDSHSLNGYHCGYGHYGYHWTAISSETGTWTVTAIYYEIYSGTVTSPPLLWAGREVRNHGSSGMHPRICTNPVSRTGKNASFYSGLHWGTENAPCS